MENLIESLKKLVTSLNSYIVTQGPKLTPDTSIKTMQKEQLLVAMCAAIQEHEGWYPGSCSFRNRNPGNLKYAVQKKAIGKDDKGFARFATYEDGLQSLENMILNAARGNSSVYKSTMTLLQFFQKYAPSSDNNNPLRYAEVVAKRMGVPVNFTINGLA